MTISFALSNDPRKCCNAPAWWKNTTFSEPGIWAEGFTTKWRFSKESKGLTIHHEWDGIVKRGKGRNNLHITSYECTNSIKTCVLTFERNLLDDYVISSGDELYIATGHKLGTTGWLRAGGYRTIIIP